MNIKRFTEYFGKREPLIDVARRLGIPYNVLCFRLFRLGWTEAASFCTPVAKRDGRSYAPKGQCVYCDERRTAKASSMRGGRKRKALREKREGVTT
jgi:hypothetical protein